MPPSPTSVIYQFRWGSPQVDLSTSLLSALPLLPPSSLCYFKNIFCFYFGILHRKLIYKFNSIPVKIPARFFFAGIDKIIPKFIGKDK